MSKNNNELFWKTKIMAFLHDTADKAFLLSENKPHEDIAKELIKELGIENESLWNIVKDSDHISAASDRVQLENIQSNFKNNPVLIHPISSENYDLKSLKTLDTKELKGSIESAIDTIINTIKDKQEDYYKKMFFLLWADLNKELKSKKDKDGMGALWNLMPADTRIPNHTIWHHNRIASAFAGALYDNEDETSMVLMTIGPVQDFINVARTTSDFWAGSYLMSYLSWKGMEVFVNELGPDSIIFPDLKGQPFMEKYLQEKYNYNPNNQHLNRDILRPSLPNRWLVIAPKSKAEELAKKSEEKIREEWNNLRNKVAENISLKEEFKKLDKQNNFLEVYYSILNIPKDDSQIEKLLNEITDLDKIFKEFLNKNTYKKNIGTYFNQIQKAIEKIMGARKSIRFSYGEPEYGYKCTLCGKREVVHKDGIETGNYKEIRDHWRDKLSEINQKIPLCIKENEMLCSVCLTKRVLSKKPKEVLGFGRDNYHYPSLTEIAVADFKSKLIKLAETDEDFEKQIAKLKFEKIENVSTLGRIEKMTKELEKKYNKEFNVLHIDGEYLFEETYEEEENKDKKEAYKDFETLMGICKKYKIPKPSPYIGFIYFDGDNMGKWISQTHENMPKLEKIIHPSLRNNNEIKNHFNNLLNEKPPMGPHFQSAISSILLDFSLYIVRFIVETENVGLLVYSGGDDVVAMAPLSETLKIAERIRYAFSHPAVITDYSKITFKEDNKEINFDDKDKEIYLSMGKNATGSCGITIAHYHNSLTDSLEKARIAEKYAKKTLKRNAFGINMLKRSGEHSLFGLKWYQENKENTKENISNIDKINKIVKLMVDDKLSPAFITQFYQEVDTYWNMEKRDDIIKDRLSYLFNRHYKIKPKSEEEKKEKEDTIKNILSIMKIELKENSENDSKKKELDDINNFKGILSLILFISRNSKIILEEKKEEQHA